MANKERMREPGLFSLQERRCKWLVGGRKDEGTVLWALGPVREQKAMSKSCSTGHSVEGLGKVFLRVI